ncbi:HPr family phosphocarrier protein [Selenomonas sp. oral taxon 136]|uniref:HPr family phosphocarrier protein n=1 Tax=Selenomonas sp. oral taxon 136 TaxID=713030 RepID=UPI00076838D9|nr:HPr family phosphocarrier protein [Selenomonas sp. oral taxon 136]AME04210.1 PTS sugar transporter subunit IIB [Selenomonas sp. oral taxon 136]
MKVTITLENASGLHARPAVLIAEKASKFHADILLHANGKTAKATDVLQIMGLGITCGTEVTVEASGEEENAAVYTLAGMMAAKEIYQ